MRHIEKDGSRQLWPDGAPVPDGWTAINGPVPGPAEPSKRDKDLEKLKTDVLSFWYDHVDDPDVLDQISARIKGVKSGSDT